MKNSKNFMKAVRLLRPGQALKAINQALDRLAEFGDEVRLVIVP